MASISVKTIKEVKEVADKVLSLLNVKGKTLVSAEEDRIRINVDTPDSALLIGRNGENLYALRQIISLISRDILPEDISITVDVGDYLKEKEKRILGITENAIKKVKDTGYEETLPNMNPYERRLAHQRVSDTPGVESHSEGEGRERKVVIRKKIK